MYWPYYIFYFVLIYVPLLVAAFLLVFSPGWFVVKVYQLVRRYRVFGWKVAGVSLVFVTLAGLIKPPSIYYKSTIGAADVRAAVQALEEGQPLPAPPPEIFDFSKTMFALIFEPPIPLYVALVLSFLAFRWLLAWQPKTTDS